MEGAKRYFAYSHALCPALVCTSDGAFFLQEKKA